MATDKELAKAEETNQSLRRRITNVNRQQKERGRRLQRKAVVALGSYAMGRYDVKERFAVAGLDGHQAVALAAIAAPELLDLDDEMADAIDSVGDAALAIAGYEMGVDAADEDEDEDAAREERPRE